MTTTDIAQNVSTDLGAQGQPPPVGPLRAARRGHHAADHHPRRGRHHLGRQGQELHRRAVRPVRGAGRPRPQGARRGGRQAGRDAGLLPAVVLRDTAGDRTVRAPRQLRAGRTEPGLLHDRRRRGRRDRLEAGEELLQAGRQARQAQGGLAVDRLSRHAAGRAGDHRPSGVQGAVRAADARWVPCAEHQLLPRAGAVRHRHQGVRARTARTVSPRPSSSRAPTPSPRCSWSRCRTRVGASHRRPGTSSGFARSATSTTCCWCPTR